MTGLIDTHAHLYEPCYMENTDEFMAELKANGVEKVVCVGCELKTSKQTLALADKYDFIYAEVGFHPCDTKDVTEEDWEQMKKLLAHPKVVALGEIGLDYYWENSPRDKQLYWFEKQLDYAYEAGLPVVIHSRDAMAQTIDILKKHKIHRGVFHCYSGSKETLKELVKMGFSISLGGVITFKNARRAVECAQVVPLDRLMLETDCPFMAPEPHRGKTNRPDYTMYVAEKIGELRGMSAQEIADITRENAIKFFGL
ncbi:MAG: TatD family hydrolase [Clostridia bacterium]|nr:TatD family hydrolase [Clostridia bacterium]